MKLIPALLGYPLINIFLCAIHFSNFFIFQMTGPNLDFLESCWLSFEGIRLRGSKPISTEIHFNVSI